MQYWKEMALPTPEPAILTEEKQLVVLRDDIGIPTPSDQSALPPTTNRNTQDEQHSQENQQAFEEDAIHQAEEDHDMPQGVVIPYTLEPDVREHQQESLDTPNDTLPGSFPREEPPELPPSPPEERKRRNRRPSDFCPTKRVAGYCESAC